MTEAKMTPSPPCFGAKMFDYISNTEVRYNNALFFIKLYTADEEKITKTGN